MKPHSPTQKTPFPAKQESAEEPKTSGPEERDCLASRVELSLHQLGDPDLCRIRCVAEGGHVTLEGFVRTYTQKRMAQAIATHVEGVRTVTNSIAVPR